ncbi:uncharacterized protein LOC129302080 [Prosopis cineraria]|uniref:uncharacterized protein LOC129302080 n=1 Tax=Prosopis cineraria TaxID=364024 RepID=UPI00240FB0B7|nr:uncharacterized protein LOC129302080 [Prosopis cineraria]
MKLEQMMICFRIAGGQIVPEIDMLASETILDLKLEIEKELSVEVERQSLWYNTRQLRNDGVIREYKFRESETLNLRVRPMAERREVHVLVKQEGANGYVRVSETDNVSHLRKKIEKYWGIPRSIFTLRRFDKQMEDDVPLLAYYITEDTEVELCVNIEPR